MLCTRLKYEDISRRFTVMLYPPPPETRNLLHNEYKYKIEDCPTGYPPRQDDPILRVIIATIRELNTENMTFAAAGIRVRNLTNCPPIWPSTSRNSGTGINYASREQYQEFPITVPVSLTDRRGRLTGDEILVRTHGEWKPLRTWLLSLPNEGLLLSMKGGALRCQQRWWERNRKSFPFMKLPVELRLVILRHILGSDIYPGVAQISPNSTRVTLGRGKDELEEAGERGDNQKGPNYKIFQVSKQICAEALQAGWVGSSKHFDTSKWGFEAVVNCPNPPAGLNWLASIDLHFDVLNHFSFFRIKI